MIEDILTDYAQSLDRLKEALAMEPSAITRDAAIKRFEFTFELAWKTAQKILRAEGIVCQSPKSCLDQAFALGLIADDPRWIDILNDRNLTVHTYDETLAQAVHSRLSGYVELFQNLLTALQSRKQG